MADLSSSIEVPLPQSVEEMLQRICIQRSQPPPDTNARRRLASLGEHTSLEILRSIFNSRRIINNLNGYIVFMAKNNSNQSISTAESVVYLSPQKRCSPTSTSSTSVYTQNDARYFSPISKHRLFSPASSSEKMTPHKISHQLWVLGELEFRKAFLILCYIGRSKLEDVMSPCDADSILRIKDIPMVQFEFKIWEAYGKRMCCDTDRRKCLDWDSNKTHWYYCYVCPSGNYFKGPFLNRTRTHLQRVLGDENVLIVKFADDDTNCNAMYSKIAKEGILVGTRRYHFFVFKDGGKEEKRKSPTSSAVKCYFVRMESIVSCDERELYILSPERVHQARSLFMHVHTVDTMAKYIARFSLILSKTIKLQVDLASVRIKTIDDIFCRDENGCVVYDEDGEPVVHTDGTGYISEDLAMQCPKDFYSAKFIKDGSFEMFIDHVKYDELRGTESCTREPPLLMQCRLFHNGRAVKGTLLVNKKLATGTIQIRRSMIKVRADERLSSTQSFNSLEIVAVSHKPKRNVLSKNLIALLSYGGVPKEYFFDLLRNALEDTQCVYSNKRAALRVALNHGEMDDYTAARMILSGVPLTEPFLQHRLSCMASEDRKGLKGGRLPISESFYLMGTADPIGVLNNDEVCVILENGQISGKVLVYRNPGLHFGDIHVLNAVYVKALEDIIGNAKYAIFFSTKGQRSVANEIANGDFDGDMYWVSRNPQLLSYFKPSKPWKRMYSTPTAIYRKPSELSAEELEDEYFQLFLKTREPSYNMSVAADSWLAFMDRLLILGDGNTIETNGMKEKMLRLIDIYYDALDAPKSGKNVQVPDYLKADLLPHYMGRMNCYHSSSVLGLIHDTAESSQTIKKTVQEIWKLPCFDIEIPEECLSLWSHRYSDYRGEMLEALKNDDESKNDIANDVIKKYKQLFYDAPEFEESTRNMEEIFNEALAIYHLTYDYAAKMRGVEKCGFAWKIAGSALCKLHAMKQNERSMICLPSVMREVLN